MDVVVGDDGDDDDDDDDDDDGLHETVRTIRENRSSELLVNDVAALSDAIIFTPGSKITRHHVRSSDPFPRSLTRSFVLLFTSQAISFSDAPF